VNLEDIAQRHSQFDGFRLVDYCPVALPFWFVAYEAQVLAEKPIPLIDEFLLRAIQAQVDTLDDLGAFLGIGEKITVRRLGGLHANGFIRLLPAKEEQPASYALTQTGVTAVRDAMSVQPTEQKIIVAYDGVSQRVIPRQLEHYEVLTHHQIKTRGLLEIPPLPEKGPPPEDLLNRIDLNRDLPQELRAAWSIHHILSARKSGSLTRRAREAYMLVYRSDTDEDVIAVRFFSQQGRPMREIDLAFRQHEGVKKLKLAPALRNHRESLQRELAQDDAYQLVVRFAAAADPAEESKAAEQLSATARLAAEVAEKERELRLEQKAPLADVQQIEAMRAEIEKLKREKQTLEAARAAGSRRLGPHEHAPLLKRAISEAKRRLVIVSPWIADKVMFQHQRGLEAFIQRKGELFIGYGIAERADDDPKSQQDRDTLAFFQRLKSKFPRQVHVVRLGNTHAKVLIKDDEFLVIGSFNWMSFGGEDWGSGIREELSYFVKEPAHVEESFNYYLNRFAPYDKHLAVRVSGTKPA
jgi:hypothetical protein